MLQLLCYTSGKADSLNANTSLTAGLYLYACLKDLQLWQGVVRKIEHYSNVR